MGGENVIKKSNSEQFNMGGKREKRTAVGGKKSQHPSAPARKQNAGTSSEGVCKHVEKSITKQTFGQQKRSVYTPNKRREKLG